MLRVGLMVTVVVVVANPRHAAFFVLCRIHAKPIGLRHPGSCQSVFSRPDTWQAPHPFLRNVRRAPNTTMKRPECPPSQQSGGESRRRSDALR
jgi:hypothetical protein